MLTLGLMVAIPAFFVARDKEKLLLAMLIFFLPLNPMYRLIKPPLLAETQIYLQGAFTLKIYFTDIVLGLLFVIFVINRSLKQFNRCHFIPRTKLMVPFCLWLGIAVLSVLPAAVPKLTIFELVAMGRMFLTFVIVFHYIKSTKDVHFIIKCFIITIIFQSVLMFAQFSTGSLLINTTSMPHIPDVTGDGIFRPTGGMDHSSHFAKWYGLLFCISLSFGLFTRNVHEKILGVSAWFFGAVALVMTVSRIGLGAWMISIIVFMVLLNRHRMVSSKNITISFALIFVCIIVSGLAAGSNLQQRLEERGSALSRIPMAQVAIKVIKSNPLLGVGLGNYGFIYPNYEYTIEQRLGGWRPALVHNLFLAYAAEIGIFGFIFFLWFLFSLMNNAVNCAKYTSNFLSKSIYLAIYVGVINIFIQSFTGMGFRMHPVHMSTLAILAACVAKGTKIFSHQKL